MFQPLASLSGFVLVVEPDLALARQIVQALETAGLTARHVADPRAGAALAVDPQPDLIIAELLLPGTDGLSLFMTLQRQGAPIPTIILSGRSNPVDRAIGLRLGIADWMNKPFDLDELVARSQAILRRVVPRVARDRSPQVTSDSQQESSVNRLPGRSAYRAPGETGSSNSAFLPGTEN